MCALLLYLRHVYLQFLSCNGHLACCGQDLVPLLFRAKIRATMVLVGQCQQSDQLPALIHFTGAAVAMTCRVPWEAFVGRWGQQSQTRCLPPLCLARLQWSQTAGLYSCAFPWEFFVGGYDWHSDQMSAPQSIYWDCSGTSLYGYLPFSQGRSHFGVPSIPVQAACRMWCSRSYLGGLPIAFKTSGNKTMNKIMRRLIWA